jgi:integral membrane protein (TIGR01906 family)
MSFVRYLAQGVFLLCIPLFLVLTNVRIASTWEATYDYAFSQYDVPRVTGLDRAQLDDAATEIVDYFQSAQPGTLLDIRVKQGAETIPLYNEREVLHMKDVLGLMRFVFRVQEFTFIYVVMYVAGIYLWSRERSLLHLAKLSMWAGAGTAAALGLAAVAMLIGFDSIFLQFHQLSFANDFWALDPARDRLVQMFPQGFWFDVSFAVGVASIIQGGLLFLAGYGFLAWHERRRPGRAIRPRRHFTVTGSSD